MYWAQFKKSVMPKIILMTSSAKPLMDKQGITIDNTRDKNYGCAFGRL